MRTNLTLALWFAIAASAAMVPATTAYAGTDNVIDGTIYRGSAASTDLVGPHIVVAHNADEWNWLWQTKLGRDPPKTLPPNHIAVAGFLGNKAVTGYGVHLVHNESAECSSCANYVDFFETDPSAMTGMRFVSNTPYEILIIETPKPDVTVAYHRRFDTEYMPQIVNWRTIDGSSPVAFSFAPPPRIYYAAGAPVENVDGLYTNAPTDADETAKDGKVAQWQGVRTFDHRGSDYVTPYDTNGYTAWITK